ncbi:MAG: ADP-ribosylglycohydrolase family protein [Deltaproteobacteria bacterium]|nr:ADP-ribosylglycohydrolase family protein [Deltaproteobacteria bacterium]
MDAIESRRAGAWYGLAVGDALGAPVEFMTGRSIRTHFGRWSEMRAGGLWEKGEWTDDTALAIATAAAYADAGAGFQPEEALRRMHRWLRAGPKDVGMQTRLALSLVDEGVGLADMRTEMLRRKPGGAGNGSLMRAAPTGLVRAPDDPRLAAESEALSALTHPDPRCTGACVVFNAALASLVRRGPDVGAALGAAAAACAGQSEIVGQAVQGVRDRLPPAHAEAPIGFVLLCLERALTTLRDAERFEDGLVEVTSMGGDTDTNAAVAGALLGARFGLEGIPERWMEALRGKDELDEALGWMRGFRG